MAVLSVRLPILATEAGDSTLAADAAEASGDQAAVAAEEPGASPRSSARDLKAKPLDRPLVHVFEIHTVNTKGGMIDPGITAFVERVVEDANAAGVDAIVFDIDTFGGRVDAATVIRDAIVDADAL
ncbi:uncharacterized protein METZ01_LOCUS398740, partial [marine metagenome]